MARGAAYYSYVRSTGSGVLVRGGLPRTYYIGLGEPREGKFPAVCLVPRGAEEGAALEIDNDALQLVANRPVSFRLYSSLTRTDDTLGQVLEFDAADTGLHMHAPLHAVIRFGKKAEERLIPVKLGARLTEIGTLESWCESQDQRQPLAPAIRTAQAGARKRPRSARPRPWSASRRMKASLELIEAVFSPAREIADRARGSPGQTRTDHGAGQEQLAALRHPPDGRRVPRRRRRPQEEPGLRDPLAQSRAASACAPASAIPATISASSRRAASTPPACTYGNQVQCEIDWWIFWGRVAGGLNRNQQTDVYQRLSALPAAARRQEAAAREPLPAARNVALPPPAWNCCRSAPRPNSARRWSSASRPAISRRANSGASAGWARASSSTGPSIW